MSHSMQKLDEKTNKAPPECVTALCTPPEEELRDALMEYVTKAFNLTVRLSEMKDYKDIFQPSSGGLFSIDDVHPVLRVTDKIILSRPDSNALSALLHFQIICEAICALQECGRQVALNQMAELAGEGCPHGFQWAESMGLPSSQLCSHFDQYFCPGKTRNASGLLEGGGVGRALVPFSSGFRGQLCLLLFVAYQRSTRNRLIPA